MNPQSYNPKKSKAPQNKQLKRGDFSEDDVLAERDKNIEKSVERQRKIEISTFKSMMDFWVLS